MVRANKRLPSSVSVSKSALDNVTLTLQDLPEKPKENWSLREAVAVLQESISVALGKGYSYEEIAKMLTTKGVDISASSLKSYLSAAKRQKEITSPSKGKPAVRRKPADGENITMNGSSAPPSLTKTKAGLNTLEVPNADTIIADREAPKTPRRKTKTVEPTPTPRPKSAAKTSSSAVSKTKATPRTPSARTRKKNS